MEVLGLPSMAALSSSADGIDAIVTAGAHRSRLYFSCLQHKPKRLGRDTNSASSDSPAGAPETQFCAEYSDLALSARLQSDNRYA